MKEKYSIEEIKQQLHTDLNAITTALLTNGYIIEGDFTSINHVILYRNETLLIEYLEKETGLKLSCSYNNSNAIIILYDCNRYTYEEASLLL